MTQTNTETTARRIARLERLERQLVEELTLTPPSYAAAIARTTTQLERVRAKLAQARADLS